MIPVSTDVATTRTPTSADTRWAARRSSTFASSSSPTTLTSSSRRRKTSASRTRTGRRWCRWITKLVSNEICRQSREHWLKWKYHCTADWRPVYFVLIEVLCYCWISNSFTCLVKSKPVKQEVSRTVILFPMVTVLWSILKAHSAQRDHCIHLEIIVYTLRSKCTPCEQRIHLQRE